VTGLAALLLLFVTAVPLLNRARADAARTKCADNLKRIAMAAQMYVNQDVRTGSYPRLYWDTTHSERVTSYNRL